ncbi:hypothetical protein PR048_015030 [Dryococelus australis]|uniref:Uncharacterized protein n=1 Tax=Dryococelus australis TaxID=614101 RepID=A0ABQ9HFY0_9NEOP|nr:hypothetical protein PR048_015030 [Dryococelus australis]
MRGCSFFSCRSAEQQVTRKASTICFTCSTICSTVVELIYAVIAPHLAPPFMLQPLHLLTPTPLHIILHSKLYQSYLHLSSDTLSPLSSTYTSPLGIILSSDMVDTLPTPPAHTPSQRDRIYSVSNLTYRQHCYSHRRHISYRVDHQDKMGQSIIVSLFVMAVWWSTLHIYSASRPGDDNPQVLVINDFSDVGMMRRLNARAGEKGYPGENMPTSGIVRHHFRLQKSGTDPTKNRTWFDLVGRRGALDATPNLALEMRWCVEIPSMWVHPSTLWLGARCSKYELGV